MNRIPNPLSPLLCLVPGVVVLAFAAVPQSLDMLYLAGVDSPEFAESQVLIALSGALATASAILLARWWPPLVATGSLGVLLAYLLYRPPITWLLDGVRVFEGYLLWACLLVAASGVLLVGLLGAAQALMRRPFAGAAATAVIACAAFLGASIVGPLRNDEMVALTLVVLSVTAALTVLAAFQLRDAVSPDVPSHTPRILCAAAVLATLVPTALVASTHDTVFGTWPARIGPRWSPWSPCSPRSPLSRAASPRPSPKRTHYPRQAGW